MRTNDKLTERIIHTATYPSRTRSMMMIPTRCLCSPATYSLPASRFFELSSGNMALLRKFSIASDIPRPLESHFSTSTNPGLGEKASEGPVSWGARGLCPFGG